MRREFFILANVNETQRYAKWNERMPEGKRRKQMAQVNLEIVLYYFQMRMRQDAPRIFRSG